MSIADRVVSRILRPPAGGRPPAAAAGLGRRLRVSGGAHPRYARNLGTDGSLVDGSKLAPSVHTVLPTSSDAPSTTR